MEAALAARGGMSRRDVEPDDKRGAGSPLGQGSHSNPSKERKTETKKKKEKKDE